jgi:hypothetical protein
VTIQGETKGAQVNKILMEINQSQLDFVFLCSMKYSGTHLGGS